MYPAIACLIHQKIIFVQKKINSSNLNCYPISAFSISEIIWFFLDYIPNGFFLSFHFLFCVKTLMSVWRYSVLGLDTQQLLSSFYFYKLLSLLSLKYLLHITITRPLSCAGLIKHVFQECLSICKFRSLLTRQFEVNRVIVCHIQLRCVSL